MCKMNPAFREAIAVHWIVSTAFNIPMDDIFVAYTNSRFQVVVRHDGREFIVDIATLDLEPTVCHRMWIDALHAYNNMSVVDRKVFVDGTRARENAVELIMAMIQKGFVKS